jgi:hypothetical protein
MTPLDLVITASVAGIASYLGSYLKKKGENLATHEDINKLVDQVSAVTAATKQIEARITRASRVHERQLDILGKLYSHLYAVQAYFQGMMRTGRRQNEAAPESYDPKVAEAVETALAEFLNGKLFIPPELVQKCEQFFDAMFEGRLAADLAREVAFHPTQQVHFSKEAAEVAFKQLPSILQQIYDTGRAVIHDEAR